MNKWYGKIGFAEQVTLRPGVTVDKITERFYKGDVINNFQSWQTSSNVNDDLNINRKLSIVMDPYVNQNIGLIKWVEFMGVKWKVKSVEDKYPRLILTIGDMYNG